MSSYRPVFNEDAADFLGQLSKRRERKALSLARELSAHPFVRSDYALPDESGHLIEYLMIEDFMFGYWLDHAVRELRVVEIRDAS